MKRRDFISHAAAAGTATTLFPNNVLGAKAPKAKLRLCMLGVGSRGSYLMSESLSQGAVELTVVCDIDNQMISRARKMWQKHKILIGFPGTRYQRDLDRGCSGNSY